MINPEEPNQIKLISCKDNLLLMDINKLKINTNISKTIN